MPDLSSLNQAIHKTATAYSTGIGSLGKDIGVNEKTFDNKCNPNSDHKLTLSETIKVLRLSENPSILNALLPHLNLLWVKKIEADITTDNMLILSAWADWDFENAETGRAIKDALKDNRVTQKELNGIKKELNDTFEQELRVLQLIEKYLLVDTVCPLMTSLKTAVTSRSLSESIQEITLDNSRLTDLAEQLNTTAGSLKNKIDPHYKKTELNIHEVFLLSHYSNHSALVDYMAQQSGFIRIDIDKTKLPLDLGHHKLLEIWVRSASKRAETVINIRALLEKEHPQEEAIRSICHSLSDEFHQGYALLNLINVYVPQQPSIKSNSELYY